MSPRRPALRSAQAWLAAAALLLVAAAPAFCSEGAEGAHAVDWQKYLWDMAIKVIDFAIIAFLLVKFLSKPLAGFLKARAEAASQGLADLRSRLEASERAAGQYRERLKAMDEEIKRAVEEARREMDKEREQVLAEAHRGAQELIHHTQETVKREFAKAKAELYGQAVELSMGLAEELIAKNIGDKDRTRLTEDYINRIAKA